VLHADRVEGLAADGRSLWAVGLPAPPVRWGLALTGSECVVTLSDGQVLCLATPGAGGVGGLSQFRAPCGAGSDENGTVPF
jgi:hypothetical protein